MSEQKNRLGMGSEFRRLEIKVFIGTVLMMLAAVGIVYIVYQGWIHERFANSIVMFMERYIYGDYEAARKVYRQVFRNHKDLLLLGTVVAVFLIILRIYLTIFSRYFNAINRGIDTLTEEKADDVVLPRELAAVEKKINLIRHTLEERKQAAEAAEQRKSELIVYLAHDLKTPLTSVIGYLTLLCDKKQLPEELREKYLSISLEKAQHLEDLIDEFFEITRLHLSNITLEYSEVNLTRLLEQLTFEFQPMLAEKNLKCVLHAQPDMKLRCDVDKMQRVLDNLLRNAVNYSFEDTVITITAAVREGQADILFQNSGNTIPQDKLDRIFDQFFRLDAARGSETGGAGLGLAIAKEIVTLHGGTISARSRDETVEFEITMPAT